MNARLSTNVAAFKQDDDEQKVSNVFVGCDRINVHPRRRLNGICISFLIHISSDLKLQIKFFLMIFNF
jgi:hypothetical protein